MINERRRESAIEIIRMKLVRLLQEHPFVASFAIATRGVEIGRALLLDETRYGGVADKTLRDEYVERPESSFGIRYIVVSQMTPDEREVFYQAIAIARTLYPGEERGRFPDYRHLQK